MALNDFFPVEANDLTYKNSPYDVQAGATAILPGEPVIQDAGNPSYVIRAANGASSTATWIGVAASASTQTASADGQIFVIDDPQVTFRGKATTPANLVQAIKNTKVTLDLTGSSYTVDENDTTNGTFVIKDFNAGAGTVDFRMAAIDHIDN